MLDAQLDQLALGGVEVVIHAAGGILGATVFSERFFTRQGDDAIDMGRGGRRHQVSAVSTVRRSWARNSADCISFKRETVRGNS